MLERRAAEVREANERICDPARIRTRLIARRAGQAEHKTITLRALAERAGVARTCYSRDPARRAQIVRGQALQQLVWTIKSTHRGKAGPR